MQHFLCLDDFSSGEVRHVVQLALEIKRNPKRFYGSLEGRWLLMLFQKTSTRTRLSFEMGVKQLGGDCVVMDWDKSNFAISPIRYEATYVSRHVDLLIVSIRPRGRSPAIEEMHTIRPEPRAIIPSLTAMTER